MQFDKRAWLDKIKQMFAGFDRVIGGVLSDAILDWLLAATHGRHRPEAEGASPGAASLATSGITPGQTHKLRWGRDRAVDGVDGERPSEGAP